MSKIIKKTQENNRIDVSKETEVFSLLKTFAKSVLENNSFSIEKVLQYFTTKEWLSSCVEFRSQLERVQSTAYSGMTEIKFQNYVEIYIRRELEKSSFSRVHRIPDNLLANTGKFLKELDNARPTVADYNIGIT